MSDKLQQTSDGNEYTLNRRNVIKGIAAASAATIGVSAISSPVAAESGALEYLGQTGPGAVYQHQSGSWTQIGSNLTNGNGSVTKIAKYNGDVFVAVTTHTNQNSGTGKVYKLDGSSWTLVGDNLENNVCTLDVFDGELYAGTAYGVADLYRYDGPNDWTKVVHHTSWEGFSAAYVWDGKLFLGDSLYDRYGYYDGNSLTVEQPNRTGSCVYDFVDHNGELYGGNWVGILRRRDGGSWGTVDRSGSGGLLELETHDDDMYVGQEGGTLYRWDASSETLNSVHDFPDSVISLQNTGDTLYIGIGHNAAEYDDSYPRQAPGELYSYQDGDITRVSDNDQFGNGVQVLTSTETIEVTIDIKPCSDPNAINPDNRGVIPVAIKHTDEFDPVERVDVSTLRFGAPDVVKDGGGATPAHNGHVEDTVPCDGDGKDDLVLHFPTGDADFDGDEDIGWFEGETKDGTPLFGTDSVKLVGR